mgnify:FL=1
MHLDALDFKMFFIDNLNTNRSSVGFIKGEKMNSKSLSSWMLIASPILFFVVFIIGWDVVIGSSETASEELANIMTQQTTVAIFAVLGTAIFISMAAGPALLAWSKVDGSTLEGNLAFIATMIFGAMSTIALLSMGMGFPVIAGDTESMLEAEWIWSVSDSMFAGLFLAWTFGNVLLGASLWIENKINKIASGILLLAGILMLIMHLLIGEVPEDVGFIPFIFALVATVIVGVFNLRSES